MVLFEDDEVDNRRKVILSPVKLKEDRNALRERNSGPSSPRWTLFPAVAGDVAQRSSVPGLSLQSVKFPSDCDRWIRDFRGYILA